MSRTSQISRSTGETDITVSLSLDGSGEGERRTGVGFFDHMLDAFARHGGLDLDVDAKGDLETGSHHTVEDVGIVIGQALDEALGDRAGIARFADVRVVMDESRAAAAIDISGRPYCAVEAGLPPTTIGGFESGLAEEFFRAVANNAKLTAHVWIERDGDPHHMIEAMFKAFARALRQAVSYDSSVSGIPSTKGLL
jgi:imidazoleglycerol-phosphate dehydratase